MYRHPHILRYINGCAHPSTGDHYVFTEKVSPLSGTVKSLGPLQICLGLCDVVEALQFLHERGKACHNNLEEAAILVTSSGRWRLAGMEYVKK